MEKIDGEQSRKEVRSFGRGKKETDDWFPIAVGG
jgi:hypothetical protein